MLALLRSKLSEVLRAFLPLFLTVCVLQVALVHAPAELFLQFVAGSVLALAGMVLLFVGIDYGILPMGRFIGAALPGRGSLWLIVAVAFALGFATTTAEPDVLVLAEQVEQTSGGAFGGAALAWSIAAGVGLFTALAVARIVWGLALPAALALVYGLTIVLTLLAPADVLGVAYDAGSVTTGVLSAPVVLALALGLTSVLGGRSSSDGFGVLGLASIGPVIVILFAAVVSG